MDRPVPTMRRLVALLAAFSLLLGLGLTFLAFFDSTAAPEDSFLYSLTSAKKQKPALSLSATPARATQGTTVRFNVSSSTKHPRKLKLQRWNAKKKSWKTVETRTIRGSSTISLKPHAGTWKYRATAAKKRDKIGGKSHTHKAAKSATVTIKVKPKPKPTATTTSPAPTPTPLRLSAQETQLLSAVRKARSDYATSRGALDLPTADSCLTNYARSHTTWMATQDLAVDPGAPAHIAAKRKAPAAACTGRTISALTSVVGTRAQSDQAIELALSSWLGSPYGASDQLLSTCYEAKSFSFGVSAERISNAWWYTVLISSPKTATTASGVC